MGEPARASFGELKTAHVKIACGTLLWRHWPLKGGRHDMGLIIGGLLARAGWDVDSTTDFVKAVATEAGDNEVTNRVHAARDSVLNHAKGEKVYGLPKLRETIGEEVAVQIAKHLGYVDPDEEIDELNKTFAVVRVRGQVAILEETTTVDGFPDFSLMHVDHFKTWKGNEFKFIIDSDNKPKRIPLANYWLAHKRRRQFLGLVFRPGQVMPGYYNLFRGFPVEPKPGDCSKFLAHVKDNVCSGNKEHFKWVMGWFADIVQHPTEKKGSSLALRGKQGVGKTKVGDVIGSLLGSHYFPATSPRYITGRFNSHLISCLLLHADEGFWAGDHEAEGKLRDLITGSSHPIEFKGREPYLVDNHVRVLITGEKDWQVPAGWDDRRFAVFDVADTHINDYSYFAAIDKEMNEGGREALLHYLMNFDLKSVNLRETPKTEALLEQKVASFNVEQQWWFDVLQRGELPGLYYVERHGVKEQPACTTSALHASYIHRTNQTGARYKATETKLGMFLAKAVGPGFTKVREKNTKPPKNRYYVFPSLQNCRKHWAKGQAIAWDDSDDQAVWQKDPEPVM